MKRRLFLAAFLSVAPVLASGGAGAAAQPEPSKAAPSAPATPAASVPTTGADAKTAAPTQGETTYVYLRDGHAGEELRKVPLFADESASVPVAKVQDDNITVRDLSRALEGAHGAHGSDSKASKKDFTPILDRLIGARLIVLEARETGLDELPEVTTAVSQFKDAAELELLQARVVKGVKPDPAEVEKLYKEAVREWKVKSVVFAKEEDAKQMLAQLKSRKNFDDLANQLVSQKKATFVQHGEYLPASKMLPNVLAAVSKLKPAGVTQPIQVKGGFAVLKVEGVRYPENPQARAEANKTSLLHRQRDVLQKYYDGLVKKYAKVDKALLKRLDFEAAKPGIAALEKDQRVVARIEGAKPITVGELTTEMKNSFYHGIQDAIREKKVNKHKMSLFDAILSRRIIPLQARQEGIPDSSEYKNRLAEYERSLLFSKFIEKQIAPQVKLQEEDAKKYYERHKSEFKYPTFYKLEGIGFTTVKSAQSAIDKLRAGTDFKWLNANADGQLKEGQRKLQLDGGTLAATTLPKELAKALSGAKPGDYRLYADSDSQYYAIRVLDVVGATEQPYAEARNAIMNKLYGERLQNAVKDWMSKLRKARDVKVFITRIGS